MTGKLYILRGLPASGKTTFAKKMVESRPTGEVIRLNRDELRTMMLPSYYRQPELLAEQIVTKIQHSQITHLLAAGVDVVVDDTNLRMRTARTLAALAAKANAPWICVDEFLNVPVEECIRRDAARESSVGEEVIRRMWRKYFSHGKTLEVPRFDTLVLGRPYTPPEDGCPAVIVDIDGTVALHGTRDPYDTTLYHEDTPNHPIVELVRMEKKAKNHIIFCSGRDQEYYPVTHKWIVDNVFGTRDPVFSLFMRPKGDKRNDAIIKLELFDRYIREEFDVKRVYDDRDRVIAAYRSIGLTVLQVAEGDF
jgi:predicted kinase